MKPLIQSRSQQTAKRSLDICVALLILIGTGPVVVLLVIAASIDTQAFGIFTQERVGLEGRTFKIHKIRTMRRDPQTTTFVTTTTDPRITSLGRVMRRLKIDELPQAWNVLVGEMSLVGPRPDIIGYADRLTGEERLILRVRPGVTGPATLFFRDEEALLAKVVDAVTFNDSVIWPLKRKLNAAYVARGTFWDDVKLLWRTVVPNESTQLDRMIKRWDPRLAVIGEAEVVAAIRRGCG